MNLRKLFELQSTYNKYVGLDHQYFINELADDGVDDQAKLLSGQWIDDLLKQ